MAEPHVTHVHGQECDDWLRLRWHGPNGADHFALPLEVVAALRIHLARPEVPTPKELATEIVEDWVTAQIRGGIAHRRDLTEDRTLADLVDRFAGALEAERERKDEGRRISMPNDDDNLTAMRAALDDIAHGITQPLSVTYVEGFEDGWELALDYAWARAAERARKER